MPWTVETLSETVDDEIAALPRDMRAKLIHIYERIEAQGLPMVREPHVKPLRGKIWEIRVKSKNGIARALYTTAAPQRVVILRTFIKKAQKTPKREIDLAEERSKQLAHSWRGI